MNGQAAPVPQAERILSLDAIRGVAVLGILVMNIQSFALPSSAYLNPTALGPLAGAGWWVWLLSHLFADRKFISIFSMLFGAGVLLFTERAEARGAAPGPLHYRRMAWLLVFGLAHAYLLWYGDILVTYALCGMLAFLFRKRPARALFITGLVALAFGSAIYLFFGWSMRFWPPASVANLLETWRPAPDRLAWETELYRGGWLGQMAHRAPLAFFLQVPFLLMYELWRAGGLMLVGMALYKWGVLAGERPPGFYRRLLAGGLVAGLGLAAYGVYRNVAAGWDVRYSFFLGPQWNYWAGVLIALAYIAAVVLACRAWPASGLVRRLAAVGRMAFTNYLVHTLICTTLFYGHGLGLYGRVDRLGQIAIVMAIWLLQLWYSPVWLARFRFGPFEWLWRSLTYGQRLPIRLAAPQR
jgi:uncharacterized protein